MSFILVMLGFPLVLITPWIIGIFQKSDYYDTEKHIDKHLGDFYKPYDFRQNFDAYTSEIVNRFDYSKKYFRVVPLYKGDKKYLMRQDLITGLYYCLKFELIYEKGYFGFKKYILDKEGKILEQFGREINLYEFIAYGGYFTDECYGDKYGDRSYSLENALHSYYRYGKRNGITTVVGINVEQFYLDMRKREEERNKKYQDKLKSMNNTNLSNLEIV